MTRHCRRPLLVIAGVVGFTAYLAAVALAAECFPRGQVTSELDRGYSETRRGIGLSGETMIFEVWASDATGSWTILKTTPDGLTCVVAVGEGWIDFGQMLAGEAL